MPGLLAQVSPDAVLSPPVIEPVPETLLPRLDREVRRSQVRRSWVTLAAAAAVVILITAVGALAVTWGNDDDAPPAAAPTSEPAATEPTGQPMRQVGQNVVNGTVAMTSVAWGTKLDLTCSYDPAEHEYEPPPIWTYALVVRTKDGGVEQVGTWKAIPGKTLSLTAATATRPGEHRLARGPRPRRHPRPPTHHLRRLARQGWGTIVRGMERCPRCGHSAKVARLTWVDRLWGLRPQCPEPQAIADSLAKDCGCADPWHVAGT